MFKPGETAYLRDEGVAVTIREIDATNPHNYAVLHPALGLIEMPEAALVRKFPGHDYNTGLERPRDQSIDSILDRMREGTLNTDRLTREHVDFNGHFKDGEECQEDSIKLSILSKMLCTPEEQRLLVEAGEKGVPLDRFIPVYKPEWRDTTCLYCGEEPVFASDGVDWKILGKPCTHPEGIPFTCTELNVPSGKIVVANDLRSLFPFTFKDKHEGILWQVRQQEAAAAEGMAYAYVGNSCPGVYKLSDTTFKIANPPTDERWDEEAKEWVDIPEEERPMEGERVAGICTDLWWYSICDYDEFVRRIKDIDPDADVKDAIERWDGEVVDIEPGVYEFRHHNYAPRDNDYNTETVYTTVRKVREPDPLTNYMANRRVVEHSAEVMLVQHIKDWPTLYAGGRAWEDLTEEERPIALAGAANQIMCVNGNGIGWHENGFPNEVVDPETVGIDEMPPFTFMFNWYENSPGYSTLTRAAGVVGERSWYRDNEPEMLNPSFARLAFNVCQSIISYGGKPHLDSRDGVYWVDRVRTSMRTTAECYWNLREKYPEHIFDEQFDQWMQDKAAVMAWIEHFDLGPDKPEPKKPLDPAVEARLKAMWESLD